MGNEGHQAGKTPKGQALLSLRLRSFFIVQARGVWVYRKEQHDKHWKIESSDPGFTIEFAVDLRKIT